MALHENGAVETESVIRKGVIHILNVSCLGIPLLGLWWTEGFPFRPYELEGRLRSVSSARVDILKRTA